MEEKRSTLPFSCTINVLGSKIEAPSIDSFFREHGPYLDEIDQLLNEAQLDDSEESDLFLMLMNDSQFQEIIAQLNSEEITESMDEVYIRTFKAAYSRYLPADVVTELFSDEMQETLQTSSSAFVQRASDYKRIYKEGFHSVKCFMRRFDKALDTLYASMRQVSKVRAFCLKYLLSKMKSNALVSEAEAEREVRAHAPESRYSGVTRRSSMQIATQKWLYGCPPTDAHPEELDPYELIVDKPLKTEFGAVPIDTGGFSGIEKAFIARDGKSPISVKLSIVLFPKAQEGYIILNLSAFDGSIWNHTEDPDKLQFCLEDLALQYGEERRNAYLVLKDALMFEIAAAVESSDSIVDSQIGSVLEDTGVIGTIIDEGTVAVGEEVNETLWQECDEEELEGGVKVEADEGSRVINYRGHVRDKTVSIAKVIRVAWELGITVNKSKGKGSHIGFYNPKAKKGKVLGRGGGKIPFCFVQKHFKELGVERDVILPCFFKSLKRAMKQS